MEKSPVIIRNAHTHNLKHISVEIPRNKVVVFTGVSGSGKSSLVFNTLYTESQRQLIETFSSFAKAIPIEKKHGAGTYSKNFEGIARKLERIYLNKAQEELSEERKDAYQRYFRYAEHIIDIGPGAGSQGGEIIYSGSYEGLKQSKGLTAEFLNRTGGNSFRRRKWDDHIAIRNASVHNLKNISVSIPKGVFTCITGVAGSGKSSLINDVFVRENPEAVVIDQSPVGKSSRSNPATYIGVFDQIRKEFAGATGSNPSLFSFNSAGACPKCKGLGEISYEMSFMDEVKVVCDECNGKRYTEAVLQLKYRDKTIDDILHTTIAELPGFFRDKEINRKLGVLSDVGLGYLELGQPLSTLSGGECQRIKLASELHKKGNIYVMDEPTTGLHMADIEKLMAIIEKLVSAGNTVLVIEHNLDVVKRADWVIDLGPGGGRNGGEVLFEGTPEALTTCDRSHTGVYLKEVLG